MYVNIKMGQCITVSVGNTGPIPESSSTGQTNIDVGTEDEEEEEECLPHCLKLLGCALCL